MIQAKTKSALRFVSPSPGHILLLSWIRDDEDKKELFKEFLNKTNTDFEFDVFTNALDSAADRCFEEFKDVYSDKDQLTVDELFRWYKDGKENYSN